MQHQWLLQVIRWYQQAHRLTRPYRVCRFEPSCSQYTYEAVERFGVKGLWLGWRRMLRCHPGGGSGFDPVPQQWKNQK